MTPIATRMSWEMPLSFAQQRLWLIHQLEPESAVYNVPRAVRLRGEISTSALWQSLQEIVRRHETLRTRFETRDGGPVQIIDEPEEIPLPLIDISGVTEAEREEGARSLTRQEAMRPFDLKRGPVWRAAVARISAEDHLLLICLHHVASDGWSTGVLVREFTQLYEAYRAGDRSPLAELPVQYADFAVWQRQWLQGEALDAELEYWRRRLANLSTLELPTDRPRPATPSHRGARAPFRLSPELTENLKELSRREGVSLFMTLLAAFQLVLGRYAGQEDVVVGSAIANRNRVETEGLIGFFVNQLVLRTDLSGNPSFRELLQQVRETTLGAYEHQDLPFEKLVEELQPDRSLSHTPIYQVLFIWENLPLQKVGGAHSAVVSFQIDNPTSKFDWVVTLQETEEGISGSWRYRTELFDKSTIERVCLQFQTLLNRIVASPHEQLGNLKMVIDVNEKPSENSRQLNLIKKARPNTVLLPIKNLVSTEHISPGQGLPLVMTPAIDDFDPIEWAATECEFIEKNLLKHGAILFRGFKIEDPAEFERFTSTICPELFAEYGDLPREGVSGRVYGSTPYPNDQAILFHNESSHMHCWPLKIWFYCLTSPQQGGETPVVDCRDLCRQLDPALKQKFFDKGLLYVRNFGDGFDVSWQEFFRTSDPAAVEEFCFKAGILCEWRGKNSLRTKRLCTAVTNHPHTGEQIFFNQLQAHHISCLDPVTREVLLRQYGEEWAPRNVYYGDGERIPDTVVNEVKRLYDQNAKSFTWRRGDILMLDNMLVAHGRNPFVGPRKIVVAMGEMIQAATHPAAVNGQNSRTTLS